MSGKKTENDEFFKGELFTKPLPPDDPHYQAIGRVASAWAMLDFNISYLIWQLAGIDEEHGACLTSNMLSINMRVNTMLALLGLKALKHPEAPRHDGRPQADSFVEFCKKMAKLNNDKIAPLSKERNRIVHDAWVHGGVTGHVAQVRASAEKKLDYGYRAASITEIDTTHEKIVNLIQEFSKLQQRILARLHLAQLQECAEQQNASAPQKKG